MSKFINFIIISIYLLLILYICDADKPCKIRRVKSDRVVCVCNAEYCDEISKIKALKSGRYIQYTSNREGKRFEKSTGFMHSGNIPVETKFSAVLNINRNQTFQKIIGFGGAFTDSFGIVAESLSIKSKHNLLSSYFGENGLEYNMGRVPIGSADFSDRFYVYNMQPENDFALSNFTLDENDYKYKISSIKYASKLATDEIYMIANSWSCPEWMVKPVFFGRNIDFTYFQVWADYHLRFLQEYKKNDVNIWALTTGNEPSYSIFPIDEWNGVGWLPIEQGKWLVNNLGPTIKNSEFRDIKILGYDDQRLFFNIWLLLMETINGVSNYMDGITTHWYTDRYIPILAIDIYHKTHPNKIIISNEASSTLTARDLWDKDIVQLGYWRRGELYILNIIECLNHWYMGWMDWNLAVNEVGGPVWSGNLVGASVIVVTGKDEFLKQPAFYAMGHFSKFIPRNSVRISVEGKTTSVKHVAFLREDGGVTVVLYNPTFHRQKIMIKETGKGYIDLILSSQSVTSLIYW